VEDGYGVMLTVRIHGRGGQEVVTAAELLSVAAFANGKHAQVFPAFGSERRPTRIIPSVTTLPMSGRCGSKQNAQPGQPRVRLKSRIIWLCGD